MARCSLDDPAQEVAEEAGLGRRLGDPVDLLADPMGLELGHGLEHALARDLDLIEGLDRGEPARRRAGSSW